VFVLVLVSVIVCITYVVLSNQPILTFEQQLGLDINYECNPTTGLYFFDPLSQEVKMVFCR
jgi:hypothetical protein